VEGGTGRFQLVQRHRDCLRIFRKASRERHRTPFFLAHCPRRTLVYSAPLRFSPQQALPT
jgi:hypothetical protein